MWFVYWYTLCIYKGHFLVSIKRKSHHSHAVWGTSTDLFSKISWNICLRQRSLSLATSVGIALRLKAFMWVNEYKRPTMWPTYLFEPKAQTGTPAALSFKHWSLWQPQHHVVDHYLSEIHSCNTLTLFHGRTLIINIQSIHFYTCKVFLAGLLVSFCIFFGSITLTTFSYVYNVLNKTESKRRDNKQNACWCLPWSLRFYRR